MLLAYMKFIVKKKWWVSYSHTVNLSKTEKFFENQFSLGIQRRGPVSLAKNSAAVDEKLREQSSISIRHPSNNLNISLLRSDFREKNMP